MKLIITALTLIVSAHADIHVSTHSGNDSNIGSKDYPYSSISKALNEVESGQTILIGNGIYREKLNITTDDIILKANGDSVILTGTDIVSNWENDGSSIYKAYLPTECTQLIANDLVQTAAKHPNQDVTQDLFQKTTLPINLSGDQVSSSNFNQTTDYWKGGTIWMLTGYNWIAETGRISASSNGSLSLEYQSLNSSSAVGDGVAYITNHINALDYEGEWIWKEDTLYYFTSQNINDLKIEAKTRESLIDLSNRDKIIIDGIGGYAGNIIMNMTNNSTIKNGYFKYISEYNYVDVEANSWYNSFSRSQYTDISSHGLGIAIFGSNNKLQNLNISWSAGDGVTLYGQNNRLENSIITNANYLGTDTAPVSIGGTGNVISSCNISNGGRGVITGLSAKSFLIEKSKISGSGIICHDVGNIYFYGTDSEGGEVSYNWISDATDPAKEITSWGGHGIYFDNGSKNYIAHHNVIWNTKGDAIRFNEPAQNIKAYNNTIFNSINMTTFNDGAFEDESSSCEFINNYMDKEQLSKEWMYNSNNLVDDTDYNENRINQNFIPTANSPLIDAGIEIEGITDNAIGFPDIGAYELEATIWTPGANTDVEGNLVLPIVNKKFSSSYNLQVIDRTLHLSRSSASALSLSIYAVNGTQIFNKVFTEESITLNLELIGLNKGVYFIEYNDLISSGQHKLILK